MRTIALFLFVCVSLGSLAAESGTLTLVNSEASRLYYAVDPNLDIARAAQEDAFAPVDRFKFSALPPHGTLRLEGLSPGAHTILGFWAAEDSSDYYVFSLNVSVGEGQAKSYTLKKSGALAALETRSRVFKNVLPDTAIVIDNQYADWDGYPAVAVFPSAAAPVQFTSQAKEGVRTLPIRTSNFWGRGGTQLLQVKALLASNNLYLYFSGSSAFAAGLSIFLYLFDDRQSTELNLYTIELPLENETGEGRVLLWQRGVKEPLVIGAFRNASFFLEASVDLALLPPALKGALFDKYSFDLKTSYFDTTRGFHEEFFLTSMFFRDIYVRQ